MDDEDLGQEQDYRAVESEPHKRYSEEADYLFLTRVAPRTENETTAEQVINKSRRYERQHGCGQNPESTKAQRNDASDIDEKTDSAHNKIEAQLEQCYLMRRRRRDDDHPGMWRGITSS